MLVHDIFVLLIDDLGLSGQLVLKYIVSIVSLVLSQACLRGLAVKRLTRTVVLVLRSTELHSQIVLQHRVLIYIYLVLLLE